MRPWLPSGLRPVLVVGSEPVGELDPCWFRTWLGIFPAKPQDRRIMTGVTHGLMGSANVEWRSRCGTVGVC